MISSPKLPRSVVVTWIVCAALVALAIAGRTAASSPGEQAQRQAPTTSSPTTLVPRSDDSASTSATTEPPVTSPTTTAPPATTSTAAPAPAPTPTPTAPPDVQPVDRLVVAAEGPRAGYSRDRFRHWIDADHDGCDTRAEILIAESTTPVQLDPVGCTVVAGDWVSLYDGYSTTDPTELEIDHVVALAEAWDSGASMWDDARREAFANDPDELRAVTAATNRSKSDRDPAEWQPPNRSAWCTYADQWIAVKLKWNLTADPAEVSALRNMLRGCP